MDAFAEMGIHEDVLAKSADAENETCEFIEGKEKSAAERGAKIFPTPKKDILEKCHLEIKHRHKANSHESQGQPVSADKTKKEIYSEPIKDNGEKLLEEIRLKDERRVVNKRLR